LNLPRLFKVGPRALFRVKGPARVEVKEGRAYALGIEFSEGESFVVRKDRVVCVEALESLKVLVTLGTSGGIETAREGEEVIRAWRSLAENVLSRGLKVMILGEVDSGKSTFATILLNTAVRQGVRAAFLDEDVGQSDIGWPGTVALAYAENPVYWIRDLNPVAAEFIGSATPTGYEAQVLLATLKLSRRAARESEFVVINTDGWVSGVRALNFKLSMVEAVEPDKIVIMRGDGGASALKRALESMGFNVLEAPSPPARPKKSRAARRAYRELALASLLMGSRKIKVDLRRAPLINAPVFAGTRDEKLEKMLRDALRVPVLRAERINSTLVLVAYGKREADLLKKTLGEVAGTVRATNIMIVTLDSLLNSYVGIYGERGSLLACGVLRSINLERGTAYVEAPLPLGTDIRYMKLGSIKVQSGG